MCAQWTVDLIGANASTPTGCSVERVLREDWTADLGGLRVQSIATSEPADVRRFIAQTNPDLVLLFLLDPGPGSWPELQAIRKVTPACPVIAIVPELPATALIRLFREGIADFIVPPIRAPDLLPRIGHCLIRRGGSDPSAEALKETLGLGQIVGHSPSLLAQLSRLKQVSACNATILISGETGTGKELFARAAHYLSRRSAGPFVALNCAAIPADLIENELFGHVRGAFTGALSSHPGLLEEANGGSLFLDEIDALSFPLQAKLLRFLQEKEYRPLGSTKSVCADVRVIVASNTSLEEAVRIGKFRQDLYYRINVISLTLPSLRNRREDIPLLAQHFLEKYANEFGCPARFLTLAAAERLSGHSWPGNVRELENVIQRAVLLCEGDSVTEGTIGLPASADGPFEESFRARKTRAIQDFERGYLTTLLHRHKGNISAAARSAKKNRRAFWQLLRKHRLLVEPPCDQPSPPSK